MQARLAGLWSGGYLNPWGCNFFRNKFSSLLRFSPWFKAWSYETIHYTFVGKELFMKSHLNVSMQAHHTSQGVGIWRNDNVIGRFYFPPQGQTYSISTPEPPQFDNPISRENKKLLLPQ